MNETSSGSSGAPDHSRRDQGSASDGSPLQTRAAFLKNWDWQSVIRINQGACGRVSAQHGLSSGAGPACEASWNYDQILEISLIDTLDLLQSYHQRAPFLFYNGNTFSAISRQLAEALFHELPTVRRREVISAFAHYVAGVLDRKSMVAAVESLCRSASFDPGDTVQTLRGTTLGVIIRILEDGRIIWKPDGTNTELTGLPETLKRI